MVEKVAPRAAEIDEKEEFPQDVRELFTANDVFSVVVPEEYGGFDGKLLTQCLAIEEVARVCANSSMLLGNQSLGSSPIALWGSEEQKRKYLPRIATGEILPSFALTEPGAGSDVAAMETRAVRDGDHYIINGSKIFITEGNLAGVLCVFAKVAVDGRDRVTCFLAGGDTPGLVRGKVEHKMGLRGSPTAALSFIDMRVPQENIIGEIGDGFKIALDCLDKGRISVAAQAIGLAQGALDASVEYAKTRVQFGAPIAKQQAIQFMLADMEAQIQAARQLMYAAAWRYDHHTGDLVRFSAAAKLYATDMVMRVTTDAVQIFGGYGYCREYPVERMMRDAKIFAIFEGTNQIQRMVLARTLLA